MSTGARSWLRSDLLFCVLALGLRFTPHAARGEGFIVKDGQAQAEIVVAEKPPRMTELAAQELQTYLEKISGAKLPMVTAPSGKAAVAVYVGRSPSTDRLTITDEGLKYGAFRMASGTNPPAPGGGATQAGWFALVGHDEDFAPKEPWMRSSSEKEAFLAKWDALSGGKFGNHLMSIHRSYSPATGLWEQDQRGSLNAVYEFLRDLGVRWYLPGELGEVVPKMESIAVPDVNKVVHPDFAVRRPYFAYNSFFQAPREEILWQLRLGVTGAHEGSPDGLLGLGAPGHGIEKVIGREGVAQEHPDYFAIWAGKRVHAPCLSSEELFRQTVKYVRAVFDTYDEPRVDISPTDGYASLCQCHLCKGKAVPERGWNAQLSDYIWSFVDRVAREVAKTHPGKKVGCLAYSTYQAPPPKIAQLNPNVSVILCQWRGGFHEPQTRDMFRELIPAWLDKPPSKELFIWDYYLHARRDGPLQGVPVFFTRSISDDLKFLKGKSKGEFIEVQRNFLDWKVPWDALAANHLNIYVTTRLYWNADQDLGALLDDYGRKFYGPAAPEMKAFVEYAEANWMNATRDVKIIDRLAELIGQARHAAGDTVYGKRVDLLVAYMKPLQARRSEIAKGHQGAPKARAGLREKADVVLDGRPDDKFWEGMTAYPLKDVVTGAEPDIASSFKAAAADGNLYFAIVCRDADMKSLNDAATADGDSNLWLGDNVEIMLETQSHSYYQIAISPSGAIVDLDRRNGMNTIWSANAQVAAHRDADGWSLEVRVPVLGEGQDAIDPNNGVSGNIPTEKRPWFFNVCRQRVRGDKIERWAFSPAGQDSFHVVTKFGELATQGEKP